jgi:hypothetical protein
MPAAPECGEVDWIATVSFYGLQFDEKGLERENRRRFVDGMCHEEIADQEEMKERLHDRLDEARHTVS